MFAKIGFGKKAVENAVLPGDLAFQKMRFEEDRTGAQAIRMILFYAVMPLALVLFLGAFEIKHRDGRQELIRSRINLENLRAEFGRETGTSGAETAPCQSSRGGGHQTYGEFSLTYLPVVHKEDDGTAAWEPELISINRHRPEFVIERTLVTTERVMNPDEPDLAERYTHRVSTDKELYKQDLSRYEFKILKTNLDSAPPYRQKLKTDLGPHADEAGLYEIALSIDIRSAEPSGFLRMTSWKNLKVACSMKGMKITDGPMLKKIEQKYQEKIGEAETLLNSREKAVRKTGTIRSGIILFAVFYGIWIYYSLKKFE